MEKIWKKAFFALVFVILVCFIFLAYFALKPIKHTPLSSREIGQQDSEKLELDVTLKSDELEELFKSAMEERDLPGYLRVDSDFLFLFPTEFMGQKVDLSLEGQPKVTQEGNIEISVSQVNVGQLDIPKKMALNLLNYTIGQEGPLKVGRDSETLILDFVAIGKDRKIDLKAKSIDLEKESLIFTIQIDKDRILNQKETLNGN